VAENREEVLYQKKTDDGNLSFASEQQNQEEVAAAS